MSLPWGSERWLDEAQQPGFVVLRTPEGWRTFRSPLRILEASTPDELATAFTAIEAIAEHRRPMPEKSASGTPSPFTSRQAGLLVGRGVAVNQQWRCPGG